MLKITLGEMLRRFRIEKNVEAGRICEGLCTQAMMSYFESGKRIPDTLLFECMMERMGVTPELFSIMVSREEYDYCEWRTQVCETIENGDWERLAQLLNSPIVKKIYCNSRIEKQFLLYASAIYAGINERYEESVFKLKEAAQQTIPNIYDILDTKVLLSATELHILILYLYYGVKGKILSINEGVMLFESLERYMYNGKMDENERTKCYSKLICTGLQMFQNELSDEQKMVLCNRAIQLLRMNNVFHDILGLFELYIPLLSKYNHPDVRFYSKQYEVFKDILRNCSLDDSSRPEQFVLSKPKYYLFHEYLSSRRLKNTLTQEKLSEGICEPETYSRVESGKRKPSRKNFNALAERLELNWCYYRGEIDTADLKAYDLRKRQRIADINGDRQKSLERLVELESCLDMTSVVNVQYVKSNEYVAKYRLGLLSAEEAYESLKSLFELTQYGRSDTSQLVYYSQTELEMIAHMAQILGKMKQPHKGIELIQTVIKQMQNSKVDITYQWNGCSFVLRVLSGLYFEIGEYKTAIEISTYVKNEKVKRRSGDSLPVILDAIADALEHIGERYIEEYKKLYRYTYYIADFFTIEKVLKPAKKYYEDNFETEILWY